MSATNTLPPYEVITRTVFFSRHPELKEKFEAATLEGDDDHDDFEDDEDLDSEHHLFYFEGDISLNAGQFDVLNRSREAYIIAVNGNLRLSGKCPNNVYVQGNLHCDVFQPGIHDANILVSGTIFARHYAFLGGEDHETLHELKRFPCKVETPYFFSWFVNIAPLLASKKTIVLLMCDQSDHQKMNLPNPIFYFHDSIYCLKPECCFEPEGFGDDAPYWNMSAIGKLLQAGQPIFIEGFDIACLTPWRQALQYQSEGKYKAAFDCYLQTTRISPNWYPGWFKTGALLADAGAYEQSLPFLEKAIALFPGKYKKLNIEAADEYALAQVRLRRLDEAIDMATFSINKCRGNEQDSQILFFAYRIRGEAYVLKEEWAKAKADLDQALKKGGWSGPAVWLMGLVHHHLGDSALANKHHQRAKQNGEQYKTGYDNLQHKNFIYYKPPVVVDWAPNP